MQRGAYRAGVDTQPTGDLSRFQVIDPPHHGDDVSLGVQRCNEDQRISSENLIGDILGQIPRKRSQCPGALVLSGPAAVYIDYVVADHSLSPPDSVTSFRAHRPVPHIVLVDLLHDMRHRVLGVRPVAGQSPRVSEQLLTLLDTELIRA